MAGFYSDPVGPVGGSAQSDAVGPIVAVPAPPPPPSGAGRGGERIPPWARIDGVEVSNWARVAAYLRAGLAPGVHAMEACDCWILPTLASGQPEAYASPVTDPAPWYDPTRPESADFLGILIADMPRTPVTSRAVAPLAGRFGGSAVAAAQTQGSEWQVTATMFAASYAGYEYGLEWLTQYLADPSCAGCGVSVLEYRLSCPPGDGSQNAMGYYLAPRVALTSGPTVTGQVPGGWMTDLAWTWVSEVPYLYTAPVRVLDSQILYPGDDPGAPCMDFGDWLCGPPPAASVHAVQITPPANGTLSAIVTINSPGVGSILIETYAACPPTIGVDVPLSSMMVRGLDGTLVIDSAQQLVTYVSPDGSEVRDGTDLLYVPAGSDLGWAEVDWCDRATCLVVSDAHPCSGGGSTVVSVDLQHRRR